MSSPSSVTQNEYPLDDDTTLMSTTDLHSYMTHTNDTFVQVSGYSLQELIGQPHNLVRHPDMPKAAFADMWYTLQKGEPWSGIRQKPPQERRPLLGAGERRADGPSGADDRLYVDPYPGDGGGDRGG
ncbi:Aerotaxis receptor [Enterobacter cancerogenus]|uniref:Aerotaxis receptor n=1 Tax=Enterobacter cancerogenus TaxID=69218 RepID=A0A484WAH7_9ENTR|nr:Aerotaxis receptor [Enterobacter cancerogenus]